MKLCNSSEVTKMSRNKCKGFSVYPPSTFYPIPWRKWNYYFDEDHLKDVLNAINDTIAIHVWNKHSVQKTLQTKSNVPYIYLARKYCPKVYRVSEEEF